MNLKDKVYIWLLKKIIGDRAVVFNTTVRSDGAFVTDPANTNAIFQNIKKVAATKQ